MAGGGRAAPTLARGGRRRDTDLHEVVSAILYKQQQGCPWRALPAMYPPWPTVRHYYDQWRRSGVWPRVVTTLRQVRQRSQFSLS